jgi:hypothetical protein
MEISDLHKDLLRQLGLNDDDFALFDGTWVRYEYDPKKGVRLYDPYYATSYNEYIGIDGWSAWSSEGDTFMSDILKESKDKVRTERAAAPPADDKEITEALQRKFGRKPDPE